MSFLLEDNQGIAVGRAVGRAELFLFDPSGLADELLFGPAPFRVALSANIAADGEATTSYGLTAPAGKTGSDFFAGQRRDDANALTFTPVADDWTKVTLKIQPNAEAVSDGQAYKFRLVRLDGTPLDTYTVTPTWTIGTPPAPPPPPRGARVDVRHERVLTLPAGFMEPAETRGVRPWMRVAATTTPALVLLPGGGWQYNPAALASDRKVYITASGQIVARTTPVSGDRLLTLSGGVLQAATPTP